MRSGGEARAPTVSSTNPRLNCVSAHKSKTTHLAGLTRPPLSSHVGTWPSRPRTNGYKMLSEIARGSSALQHLRSRILTSLLQWTPSPTPSSPPPPWSPSPSAPPPSTPRAVEAALASAVSLPECTPIRTSCAHPAVYYLRHALFDFIRGDLLEGYVAPGFIRIGAYHAFFDNCSYSFFGGRFEECNTIHAPLLCRCKMSYPLSALNLTLILKLGLDKFWPSPP
ncbi:hypothetical protein BV25DRAFT_1669205 [Artomyces pyxidatus]|uniref:Uncharacterized protein n=1 Tax=Artomyces pyxidatus TaxID=48021 RepID=A0ACB8SIS9_9AGAM|nr:hypothetical protein BV25DRAFT_1669205 [Artomyces pyxidatus]